MRKLMPLVRMKEKGQVTIPAAVREAIAAHKGDMFEVTVVDGAIVLTPQEVIARSKPEQKGVTSPGGLVRGKASSERPKMLTRLSVPSGVNGTEGFDAR